MILTDSELKQKGVALLTEALGEVYAERFITLMLREPFDYTIWQRDLWADKSIEDLDGMIKEWKNKNS